MSFSLDVALEWYLKRGLAIFPCKEKKPLVATGFKAASKDPNQIKEWWTTWPAAQIGVPTGQINDLLVVDIDGPKGHEWLAKQNWDTTFTVETSPGHLQLWFVQPKAIVTKSSAGQIAPEVDIRGDGGYVIGPFSFHHETGKAYTPLSFKTNRVEAPSSLLALAMVSSEPSVALPVNGDIISEGQRHSRMCQLAGSLRRQGLSEVAILANLQVVNQQHCKPPLDDADVNRISKDIGRKPANIRSQRMPETSANVEIESFANVPIEEIHWLWADRIASGKLNLFVGDPEKGKSLVSIDVAARVSTGRDFPDGSSTEQGDVLIVSCEDDASDTVAPRLLAAGANLELVHRIKGVTVSLPDGQTGQSFFNLERDLERLEQALDRFPNIKLIVIDPVAAFMGKIDTHVDSAVRAVLGPVAELAAKRKIAVVGIMHLRKSEAAAMLRVSGSIGFVAASRVVWGFGPDPQEPDRYVMVAVKNNLGPKAPSLAYKIIGWSANPKVGAIEWLPDKVNFSPDEVLDNRPNREYGKTLGEAERWLSELLAAGSMPQQSVEAVAEKEGLSWATIRRAKKDLGVKASKSSFGGAWIWELPGVAVSERKGR